MRQQQKFCWLQLEASKVQNSQPLRAASFTVVATCFNHSGGLKKIRDQYLSPRWAGSFGRIHILIRRSFAYVSGSFVMFRMQINISCLGFMDNSFRKSISVPRVSWIIPSERKNTNLKRKEFGLGRVTKKNQFVTKDRSRLLPTRNESIYIFPVNTRGQLSFVRGWAECKVIATTVFLILRWKII